MSLQVWLPLQGDLHNQGLLSNFPQGSYQSATNVFSQCGKIGGTCLSYSENLTTDFIDTSNNNMISLFEEGKQYSISCWIKLKGVGTSATLIQLGYSDATTYPTQGNGRTFGFWWTNATSGSGPRFVANNGDGGNTGFKLTAIATDYENWHHFAYSLDNGSASTTCKIYIDGELASTKTVSRRTADNAINTTNSNNYLCLRPYYAMYNDFRIYDHILSPKEVKEIAKGLVLHYKLDDRYVEGTTNLLSAASSFPNPSNAGFSSSNTTYGQYFYNMSNNLTTCTGSVYINNTSNLSININIGARRASDNTWVGITDSSSYLAPGEKGWLTVTANITSTYKTPGIRLGIVCSASQSNLTSLPTVQFAQLEEKDHATPWVLGGTTRTPTTVYDSSGYSNNGTIVGSLTAAAGSPRYDVATTFSTASDYFYRPHLVDTTAMNNEFTFACWLYRDYTDATTRTFYYGLCQIYLYTDFRACIGFDLASADLSYNSANTCAPGSSAEIPLQTWTHLVFTFKNGIIKGYINGALIYTDDRSANGTFIRGTRGSPQASFGYNWIGKLSDMRTYATALTDDQVKELYNTSMSIDSNGNVYARELVEL